MREDLVKKAMSFLENPKVTGNSEKAKKSFLINNGLTEEEVQEAFDRVKAKQQKEMTDLANDT